MIFPHCSTMAKTIDRKKLSGQNRCQEISQLTSKNIKAQTAEGNAQ